MAARVATSGQMLPARFHRLRGKHPPGSRAGGEVYREGRGRTNAAMKRSCARPA